MANESVAGAASRVSAGEQRRLPVASLCSTNRERVNSSIDGETMHRTDDAGGAMAAMAFDLRHFMFCEKAVEISTRIK